MTDARRFQLQRDQDPTGVSGTGTVADGVLWPDGTVTIRWRGNRASTVNWSGLDDVTAIHGHDGRTRVLWLDSDHVGESAGEQLTAVYRERARLVAHLASLHPSVITPDITGPPWWLIYVDTPAGQLSWHLAHADIHDLFAHVPKVMTNDHRAQWDGHTTAQKYERLAALAKQGPACAPPTAAIWHS